MKKILTQQEARTKLLEGVKLMYDCVCETLSPTGRNVSISRAWGTPIVVHDGVTVAKEVMAEDEFVNQAVELIREAASKTNEEAGDGTTTSTLFAYHIVNEGIKLVDAGKNPMILRREIEATLPILKNKIEEISTKTDKPEDVERVAIISSADEVLGKTIAEAINSAGKDGLVTVEESNNGETTWSTTEGMQISSGWGNVWYFITNPDRMEAVIEDAAVAVIGKKATTQMDIVPLIECMMPKSKDLVLFGDIGGDALQTLVLNKRKGNVNVIVIDPPGHGDNRINLLNDIAAYTGATVINDEIGLEGGQFSALFDQKWIGSAKKVIASKNSTVIVEGGGKPEAIAERITQLKANEESEVSIYEKEILQERVARLNMSVGVVRVGAKTGIDMRERIERAKDAISSAKASREEGIVSGGGVTFLQLSTALTALGTDGAKIMEQVLHESIKKILINSGKSEQEIEAILAEISVKGGNFGYNVQTDRVEDMIVSGVIDPAKVIRLSLENAISVATSILTVTVQIVDKLEPAQQIM